jgi:radical SAM superfamily enzyme YgiQ (UPF0313 family)
LADVLDGVEFQLMFWQHSSCAVNPADFCSFCTVTNVQGRKTRYRSPECVIAAVRRAYRESGIRTYFFTDDNFARR